MRLRNKKTGEIIESYIIETARAIGANLILQDNDTNKHYQYKSLAELNEEWEDYGGPKEYWYIDSITGKTYMTEDTHCSFDERRKLIGNYFETKEEAEKAAEKLKAWKRLKDNGFKFDGLKEDYEVIARMYPRRLGNRYIHFNKIEDDKWLKENWEDLHLLFGGEE
jgi:hypothetical protein